MYYKYISFLLISIFSFSQSKKFKVVLDAGHGGKDYGATYHNHIEKKLALAVAIKVGDHLNSEPDIDVIYTRKSDVFVELDERANIANRSKGNVFLSIHCNANKDETASGYETYVMGVTKNAANLEVAKKENAVVTLEKNYKFKYDGFDPNSPESVIGMSLLQEENLQQSIDLAGKLQQNFSKASSFRNRGVKQAGFLVLKKIAMPRVLIELGFVSNKEEGKMLDSEEGQKKMAKAIADAILEFKRNNEVETTVKEVSKPIVTNNENTKPTSETNVPVKENVFYKIQISASAKKIETLPKNFKGLKEITFEKENTIYKYFYGNERDYKIALKLLDEAKSKGYASSFIIALKNGKKVSINEVVK